MYVQFLWAEIKNKKMKNKNKNENKKVHFKKDGMVTMICTYVSEISARLSNLKAKIVQTVCHKQT